MRNRIKAFPWRSSALGPISGWPQSLRTALNLCIDAAGPTLLCWGPRFVMLYNDGYVPMLGARHSRALGQPLLEVWPESRDRLEPLVRSVMESGRPRHAEDLLCPPPAGGAREDLHFRTTCSPIRNEDGNIGGVLITCGEDIGRARRVFDAQRAELEAARQRAEEATRAKDEFLSMLGHELRNPLAPISTALQLMRLRADNTLIRERTIIERQIQHLVRLVDDLLDVSRLTRGKIQLHCKRIELSEVVRDAIELASPLLEEKNHRLEVDVPETGLMLNVDAFRLAQVVANLLMNSARYTESGGEIRIGATDRDGMVTLTVRDNGMGISPELLPLVFDLFVQGHRTRAGQHGLGLGLTLVRCLVELHGGMVSARSEGIGRGSLFEIRLPLATQRPSVPQSASSEGPREGRLGDAVRILVVDDNREAAELLADALRTCGHDVRVAFDGPEALELSEGFDPEVAVLDIGLPVMDGYELARRLRERTGGAKTHLIALTGYGQERDRANSREVGFELHLVKPVDFGMLEQSIRRISQEDEAAQPYQ